MIMMRDATSVVAVSACSCVVDVVVVVVVVVVAAARACMLRVRCSVSARVFFGSGRMTLGLCLYCALGAAALRKHCNTHSALPLL